ncbi:hypothetical protein ACLOJK_032522 [Asimina triloba]
MNQSLEKGNDESSLSPPRDREPRAESREVRVFHVLTKSQHRLLCSQSLYSTEQRGTQTVNSIRFNRQQVRGPADTCLQMIGSCVSHVLDLVCSRREFVFFHSYTGGVRHVSRCPSHATRESAKRVTGTDFGPLSISAEGYYGHWRRSAALGVETCRFREEEPDSPAPRLSVLTTEVDVFEACCINNLIRPLGMTYDQMMSPSLSVWIIWDHYQIEQAFLTISSTDEK